MKIIPNIKQRNLVLLLILCVLVSIIIPAAVLAQDEPSAVTNVTLDQSELVLVVEGEPGVLVASVEPSGATNQNIAWSSSDETVATVLDGKVIPIAVGETIVTAVTEDGGFTATCEVVVNEPPMTTVSVTGVTLDQLELTLMMGEAPVLLTATVEPSNASEQEIIWSSTDEAVATVISGIVTPITPGIAKISATSINGEFVAICEVVVEEPAILPVPTMGVYLNRTELTLTAGGDAELLVATIEPPNATDQNIIWSSSDETVATVDDGLVTPLTKGTSTIIVTTVDGLFTAVCDVTVNEVSLLIPSMVSMGVNVDPPLISSESTSVIVNYEIDEGYEWGYNADYSSIGYDAYIAGNSFSHQANVSNIAFVINGAGVFSFDYMLSTPSVGSQYSLLYDINNPIDPDNREAAMNYQDYGSFRGVVDWTNVEFNITSDDLDEDGYATIFIAYCRCDTETSNENMVAIANVCFTSGEKQLTLSIDGSEYGDVIDNNDNIWNDSINTLSYESGDKVSLTAKPDTEQENSRFYGWVDSDGNFLTTDATYSFIISADTSLKAIFAPEDNYEFRHNGAFYTGRSHFLQIVNSAESGDVIVMLEDYTLGSDMTVPEGVTLHIPFTDDFIASGNADGVSTPDSPFQATKTIATPDKTYRTLTINNGATLDIKGTVVVGSVISYPTQRYQGHTSGLHGKIVNNGDIVVSAGGTLDCWGIIAGNGSVTANSGSTVYEPFIVYDFAGGSNTLELYFRGQSPFKQYAMQNIQSELAVHYGATLYAHCNLYAMSAFNKMDAVFVGQRGVFELSSGASLVRTYDGAKYVASNTDIGKATYTFSGGMKMNYLSLVLEDWGVEISTESVDFPIPYNFDLVFKDGDYYSARTKMMPGASIKVGKDANLIVNQTLYILNGLIQSQLSSKYYPNTGALQDAGFSGSAQLLVNGTMVVNEGAIFGGIIQTDNTGATKSAQVSIKHGVTVDSTGVRDGAVAYSHVNTSVFDLPAQAYVYNPDNEEFELTELSAGKTYTFHSGVDWVLDSYEMDYAVTCSESERSEDIPLTNGNYYRWEHAMVPLNESRTGSWELYTYQYGLDLTIGTAYDSEDDTKVWIDGLTIDGELAEGADLSFTISSTQAGKGYVHLVKYQIDSGDGIILSPDTDGLYAINNVQGELSIEITSCKMADLNQDDRINNLDLVALRRMLVGIDSTSDLNALAADMNLDNKINNLDLVVLRKHLIGLHDFQ